MKICSVYDPEFKAYGRVVTGLEDACREILNSLPLTPLPEGVGYVPTEPILQKLPAADIFREHVFGGMDTSGATSFLYFFSKSFQSLLT